MKKRAFLKTAAISGIAISVLPKALALNKLGPLEQAPFALPKLSYGFGALSPYIDEETMRIHYTKHFQGYTDKLNDSIKKTTFEGNDIERIIKNVTKGNAGIRNNGGGFYNHSIFFASLSPNPKLLPEGKLQKAIVEYFGSFEDFQEQFNNSAKGVFGSGWTWLTSNEKGKLSIVSTQDQDNPLMAKIVEKPGFPLLGIDVWEHAYYLKYQNRRNEYVDAFWKVLDWNFVEKRYKNQ